MAKEKIIGIDVAEVSPLTESTITEVTVAKLLFQSIAQLRKKF